jgi:hypothetical protein
MKKDLVVKNFECGNEVKDITLSISPITFLVGPDERKKNAILYAVEDELGYRCTYFCSNRIDDGCWTIDNIETDFAKKWISKLEVVEDSTKRNYQLLIILLAIDCAIKEKSVGLIIEDPECHLYPATQSLLADMFYEAYNDYGIHFIVETHSEYLIRESQVLVARKVYNQPLEEEVGEECPFATYYVPDKSEGKPPYSLRYRKDGRFRDTFGEGFYDVAAQLAFKI